MTMFSRIDRAPEPASKSVAPKPTPVAVAPTPPPPTPAGNRELHMNGSGMRSSPSVSVITKALKITGQLESTEDIHIEGEVEGDIRGVSVKLGPSAKTHGTVYGEEVELSGTVNGEIKARKVVLTSTAHMIGDIIHQEIRIDSGAFIDGHCRPEYGKPQGKMHPVPNRALGVERVEQEQNACHALSILGVQEEVHGSPIYNSAPV